MKLAFEPIVIEYRLLGTPSEPLRTHLSAKHPANSSKTLHRRSLSLDVERTIAISFENHLPTAETFRFSIRFRRQGTSNPVFQRLDQAAVTIHVRIAAFLDRILLIVAIYKPIEPTTRTTKPKIHTSAVTGTVFFAYLELDETEHE